MKRISISIVGSGNVATNLCENLFKKGVSISSIYSRKLENALELANKVDSIGVSEMSDLDFDVDIIIVSVNDDSISEVIKSIPNYSTVLHTSGSVGIEALTKYNCHGILYPLQTFSKNKIVDLKNVPFLIEGNNKKVEEEIFEFASKFLTGKVIIANSELRSKIHLAAVFASNFTTKMLSISNDILKENDLELNLLKPLMTETIEKIFMVGPVSALTGPASRNDLEIIDKHKSMLESDEKEIYSIISNKILKDIIK